jgi:hypothetical protein
MLRWRSVWVLSMVDVDPHVVAIRALLAGTGKTWYTHRAPTGSALPYGVLEPSQGVASTTSYEGGSDQRTVRFVTRYFGVGWEQVDNFRTHTKTVLLDVRPSVSGRSSERINHETEFPPGRDEDMPDAVLYTGDSWTFSSWPSA